MVGSWRRQVRIRIRYRGGSLPQHSLQLAARFSLFFTLAPNLIEELVISFVRSYLPQAKFQVLQYIDQVFFVDEFNWRHAAKIAQLIFRVFLNFEIVTEKLATRPVSDNGFDFCELPQACFFIAKFNTCNFDFVDCFNTIVPHGLIVVFLNNLTPVKIDRYWSRKCKSA